MHSWKNESQTSENSPGCLCNHTLGYLSLGTYPWVPTLVYVPDAHQLLRSAERDSTSWRTFFRPVIIAGRNGQRL